MFCLDYYPHQSYLKTAEELKITFNPLDTTLKDFLETYQDKSIIIVMEDDTFDDTSARILKELYTRYHNFKLSFTYYHNDYIELTQKYELPFFFSNFVVTIDQLEGLMKYHPTDMYICEELGFSLDKVSALLHENNIKVRVFPNVCQSSFPETPGIKSFFIRPEDISVYELFVDVFELMCDKEQQETVYKVYKQGKWFGLLNELIPNFKGELDSKYLLNSFGVIRTRCKKRCAYDPHSCSICTRFIKAGELLKDNDITIHKSNKSNTSTTD